MDSPDNVLAGINRSLQDGWQAKLDQNGRLFYSDHNSRASQWIPPPTCWSPEGDYLPYGWEEAVDKNGKRYYINHVTCTTTREDPYDVEDIPPVEREVTLLRDRMLGFGFIAGSEKPVVVRSVTEGGPSVGKLLPGDKILRLNSEDIKMKDGPYIIERIRQSSETIRLTVIQPYIDKTGLKSSFLSANKKQKLKSKPSKVHFADNVKAAAVAPGKSPPSLVYLPSVLKVYLENGQTKSFKYDNKTSVKDVLRNLKEKLVLRSIEHFSLVVQNMEESTGSNKFTILQDDETLIQIASRPGSQQWKCLLRVTFVPQDAYDLLSKDCKAFEYFYLQCCNDVINEQFSGELNSDKAVRLAALQIQQHFLSSKQSAKVSLKALEKEDGVERFLPPSVTKKMKSKELKRLISQHIKQSQCLCAPGQKHLTELQAKLHYLKILSDLRSFGGMYFTGTMVTNVDSDRLADYNCTVLVGPKCGITQVISLGDNVTSLLADFSQLTDIQLSPTVISGDCLRVELHVKNEQPIVLLLTHDDAYDMVTLVNGYYRLFVDNNRSLLPSHYSHSQETEAPVYHGKHRVIAAEWNYPSDLVSELISGAEEEGGRTDWGTSRVGEGEYIADLSMGSPAYEEDVAYINRLKSQGRLYPAEASGGQPDGAVMSFTIYEEGEEEEGDNSFHRNANNSLDARNLSKSNASTVFSCSDKSLDLALLSDVDEDMFETQTLETGNEDSQQRQESRQEMTIDGSDEKKVFLETNEDASKPQRRKSLTKHFNVSDSVAMYSLLDEKKNDGQVKLLHYAIYNDDSLIPVREICRSHSDEEKDAGEEERENADVCTTPSTPSEEDDTNQKTKLMAQDSVVLAHKRNIVADDESTETEDDRDLKMESFRNLSSYSSSSVDSDIVDLTQALFTDNSVGEDSPCARTKPEIPPLDLSVVYPGETENEIQDNQVDIGDTSDSSVPVSIIDLPSPGPEVNETSDQAHGIQLAALDAINVSINQREELLERFIRRDPECESDSGNETISSEIIDNGVSDEPGASHSPSDYFSLIVGRRSKIESVDRDPTPTPDHNENSQEQDNPPHLSNSCLESDTDSVSTLHGSSPNLSAIDGSEKTSDTVEQQVDINDKEDSMDALIASLIIPPPPTLELVELDEELLNTVIPPPPVSDFDIGVIESLIVPPPPKSPATSSPPDTPAKSLDSGNSRYSSTVTINLTGEKAPSQEITALEIKLPEKQTDNRNASSASLKADSPIRDNRNAPSASPKKDSPIRDNQNALSASPKKDSPIRDNRNAPSASPKKDSPIRDNQNALFASPKKDSPIRDNQNAPSASPKKDSPIRDNQNAPSASPKKDSPIRDNQNAPSTSPKKDSPIKLQNATPLERVPSTTEYSPHSPVKIQASPSAGEPHPSCTNENSRPRRISSGMMSSSQDSGFCQPGPSDLDHTGTGVLGVTFPEDASKQETIEERSICKEQKQSEQTEMEKDNLNEAVPVNEDIRDTDRFNSVTRSSEDVGSVDGDDFSAVETFKALSDTVLVGIDKVGKETEPISPSLEPLVEKLSAQLKTGKPVTKPAPIVLPKPSVRPKVARQENMDSLTGGDFDTSGLYEKSEPKKTSPKAPEPPPRKRYSPGLVKKVYPFEAGGTVEGQLNSSGVQRSSSLKVNQANGEYLRPFEETVKTLKCPSSFAPRSTSLHSKRNSLPSDEEESHQDSRRGEDVNLGPSSAGNDETRQTKNGKTVLSPRLSGDIELRHVSEVRRPITRSNTFSAGGSPDFRKTKRQAPLPPPKPIRLKESPTSEEMPLSTKEKRSFRNTVSSSSPSSVAKLLSPKRSFSFLRGTKPFSKTNSKTDDSVLPSSSRKEKKESRRPRPLRAFRSLSRKDSYDVSMFDHKRERSEEPSFKESSTLRSVGGLQRPDSLDLTDNTSVVDAVSNSSVSHRVSFYETRSKSEESEHLPVSAHPQLRQSQSLGRATGRPVSYPSSPQKYPGPGSIHASLPKRPPPPRPNNPPASPRKAKYPSDESLSSSSSEVLSSPVPLPSPSGYDQDSTDSDDFSSPPPLPVSLPPVKSRPRALPEHFIPPLSFKSSKSSSDSDSVTTDSYMVELESKDYKGKQSVPEALGDIQLLISELQTVIQVEKSAPSLKQFRISKESLISEVREFTSNTKMLVSSAGQSEDQLVRSVNSSMHTLARLCSDSQQMMKAMVSVLQATNLGNKTTEVAVNFRNILSAASEAHGKSLHHSTMQLLLRQAQTMAAILSAMMRTLRMLQR